MIDSPRASIVFAPFRARPLTPWEHVSYWIEERVLDPIYFLLGRWISSWWTISACVGAWILGCAASGDRGLLWDQVFLSVVVFCHCYVIRRDASLWEKLHLLGKLLIERERLETREGLTRLIAVERAMSRLSVDQQGWMQYLIRDEEGRIERGEPRGE